VVFQFIVIDSGVRILPEADQSLFLHDMVNNRPKCFHVATISIILRDVDAAEKHGDSRFETERRNTTISAHASDRIMLKSL